MAWGFWEKYIENPVKELGRDVEDETRALGRKIDDEIIEPVGNAVEAIVENPRALAGLALAIAFPGAGAALGAQLGLTGVAAQVVGQTIINTVTNGGDVKSAVIGAALPIVGKEIANTIGTSLASTGLDATVTKILTNAATQSATAAILGKDPLTAFVMGGVSAGIGAITEEIPGFRNLPAPAQNALTAALGTKLVGGDSQKAITDSLVNDAVKWAKDSYAKLERATSKSSWTPERIALEEAKDLYRIESNGQELPDDVAFSTFVASSPQDFINTVDTLQTTPDEARDIYDQAFGEGMGYYAHYEDILGLPEDLAREKIQDHSAYVFDTLGRLSEGIESDDAKQGVLQYLLSAPDDLSYARTMADLAKGLENKYSDEQLDTLLKDAGDWGALLDQASSGGYYQNTADALDYTDKLLDAIYKNDSIADERAKYSPEELNEGLWFGDQYMRRDIAIDKYGSVDAAAEALGSTAPKTQEQRTSERRTAAAEMFEDFLGRAPTERELERYSSISEPKKALAYQGFLEANNQQRNPTPEELDVMLAGIPPSEVWKASQAEDFFNASGGTRYPTSEELAQMNEGRTARNVWYAAKNAELAQPDTPAAPLLPSEENPGSFSQYAYLLGRQPTQAEVDAYNTSLLADPLSYRRLLDAAETTRNNERNQPVAEAPVEVPGMKELEDILAGAGSGTQTAGVGSGTTTDAGANGNAAPFADIKQGIAGYLSESVGEKNGITRLDDGSYRVFDPSNYRSLRFSSDGTYMGSAPSYEIGGPELTTSKIAEDFINAFTNSPYAASFTGTATVDGSDVGSSTGATTGGTNTDGDFWKSIGIDPGTFTDSSPSLSNDEIMALIGYGQAATPPIDGSGRPVYGDVAGEFGGGPLTGFTLVSEANGAKVYENDGFTLLALANGSNALLDKTDPTPEPIWLDPVQLESILRPAPVEPTPPAPEVVTPTEPPTETTLDDLIKELTPAEPEPKPVDQAPSEPTPTEPTPSEPLPETTVDDLIKDLTPVEPAPSEPTPSESTPVEQTPTEPVQPAPEQPTPIEPTPTDPGQTPAEPTPEAPTEPTPVEPEQPVGPTPVEPTTPPTDQAPPTAGITPGDVKQIVDDALAANPNLTADDVRAIVGDAVATIPNLTADQVRQIVGSELANLPVGATPGDIQTAVTDVEASISETRKILEDAIKAAQDIGLQGDAALQAGIDSAAAEIGITRETLLGQIGKTEENLRGEFATGISTLEAQTKAQYDALTAEQKALADSLAAQGTTLADAIEAAKTETTGQIGALSEDVQAKYDALTAAQKAEADARVAQGQDLQDAITGVAGQVTGLEGQLTAQGKDFADQLVRQGMDYNTALQTAIDAQSALFGTQIGDVQSQIAAAEAARQADLQAQLAREQAAEQARAAQAAQAAKVAKEAQRQAAIRTNLGQGQQQLQQIAKQVPQAFQQAQTTTTPIYGEMGPYLDLGSPLDFDFFKPSPEKQAATKQQQPTKIATGGYIDDLLAGDMTVDDLLNLLR